MTEIEAARVSEIFGNAFDGMSGYVDCGLYQYESRDGCRERILVVGAGYIFGNSSIELTESALKRVLGYVPDSFGCALVRRFPEGHVRIWPQCGRVKSFNSEVRA